MPRTVAPSSELNELNEHLYGTHSKETQQVSDGTIHQSGADYLHTLKILSVSDKISTIRKKKISIRGWVSTLLCD